MGCVGESPLLKMSGTMMLPILPRNKMYFRGASKADFVGQGVGLFEVAPHRHCNSSIQWGLATAAVADQADPLLGKCCGDFPHGIIPQGVVDVLERQGFHGQLAIVGEVAERLPHQGVWPTSISKTHLLHTAGGNL